MHEHPGFPLQLWYAYTISLMFSTNLFIQGQIRSLCWLKQCC